MAVPIAARWVAAAFGILLVLTSWQSVIGTLIVPRPVASWLTRWVDRTVVAVYVMITKPFPDYERRDRILATQAAAILVGQLITWLAMFLVGFTLLLWPAHGRSITKALTDAGSSIFTLGFAEPPGTVPAVVIFLAAGPVPFGSEKPRVKIDEPASVSAEVMPTPLHGHSTSVYPITKIPSQPASWVSRIAAAWVASTRSRRL